MSSSSALRFEADRVMAMVMGALVTIAAAIGVPTFFFITQKITTVPGLIGAGAVGLAVGGYMTYRRLRYMSLEWVELTDDALAVGINKKAYRIPWADMTQVVQNFDPEEEWYIYTGEPRWALRFDPSALKFEEQKAMREFIKAKVGYETASDPAYATRHGK